MKAKRPWIQSNRKPLCDSLLVRISKTWDAETWEAYLIWYQKPRKEALVLPATYDLLCNERSEPLYQEFGYETNGVLAHYCDILLKKLPRFEAQVLRLYFYEGLTELQISIRLRRSKSGVHDAKKRGLFRLRQKSAVEKTGAIRIMRALGASNASEHLAESDQKSEWAPDPEPILTARRIILQRGPDQALTAPA